jgi:hypothetical protein
LERWLPLSVQSRVGAVRHSGHTPVLVARPPLPLAVRARASRCQPRTPPPSLCRALPCGAVPLGSAHASALCANRAAAGAHRRRARPAQVRAVLEVPGTHRGHRAGGYSPGAPCRGYSPGRSSTHRGGGRRATRTSRSGSRRGTTTTLCARSCARSQVLLRTPPCRLAAAVSATCQSTLSVCAYERLYALCAALGRGVALGRRPGGETRVRRHIRPPQNGPHVQMLSDHVRLPPASCTTTQICLPARAAHPQLVAARECSRFD